MGSRYDSEPRCGISCLKYVLFIFNFFLWCGGAAVTGVGIWTLVEKYDYAGVMCSNTYAAATYILLVSGILIIFVATMGCCGAVQEQKCCLLIYFLLIFFIFLLELVAGIVAYAYRQQIDTELQNCLNESLVEKYGQPGYEAFTESFDAMQGYFNCCGAASYKDWDTSMWKKTQEGVNKVPDSCCKSEMYQCGIRDHASNIYRRGCKDGLGDYIGNQLLVILLVCLGVCVFQILGLIFSMCLLCHLKHEDDDIY
ncbi:CD151 antigen-like [Antedon mediterranea]|uniref:CD151 antigen-like n=1 Tax=Antedon mediterranea TaxID=105859 RepID=UPI003AF5573F